MDVATATEWFNKMMTDKMTLWEIDCCLAKGWGIWPASKLMFIDVDSQLEEMVMRHVISWKPFFRHIRLYICNIIYICTAWMETPRGPAASSHH